MTVEPTPTESVALTRARDVVELCLRACEAYGRPDLATRLGGIRRGLADPAVHIVVAGEFKQGKSSLVNALLGAAICPVDDDVATAVPTYVRHGPQPRAQLLYQGDPLRREPISLDDVRAHVVERDHSLARAGAPIGSAPAAPGSTRPAGAGPAGTAPGGLLVGVEIEIPRKLLSGGLVLVDTPGVGGLGSAHAAASLAAIAMADAVVFISDASQELTRSELDFVHHARQLCRTVVCVLTKTDFYPAWRTIRELNQTHLRAVSDVPLMAVSSTLRSRAAKENDTALNAESGFPDLVRFVTERVGGGAAERLARDAAGEVMAICDQINAQFDAERAALTDPEAAQRVIDGLNAAKQRVEVLRSSAAKWNQTLSDGVADLNADVDHDLRARIRTVLQEADDSVENIDPADTWPQMESWLQSRISYELLANYTMLRTRADALSADVGEHFREASGQVLEHLAVYNPTSIVSGTPVEHKIELERMKVGKQAMVALKSAYGGALMFTMLGAMTGIVLGPISVGIGLVMGHKGLREEKKRQLLQRRNQARNAIRRYCDEVSFVMGKDSRDTLRRIQRQLRDHYSALAEELNASNSAALTAASEAAKRTQSDREQRTKALDAEIGRLRALKQRAEAVTGAAS